jgi:hypothetical protein
MLSYKNFAIRLAARLPFRYSYMHEHGFTEVWNKISRNSSQLLTLASSSLGEKLTEAGFEMLR